MTTEVKVKKLEEGDEILVENDLFGEIREKLDSCTFRVQVGMSDWRTVEFDGPDSVVQQRTFEFPDLV